MTASPSESPAELAITPRGPIDAHVRVPGSKSLTNRALLAAALADGESQLAFPLASDDTDRMRESLGALGCRIDAEDPERWHIRGCAGRLHASGAPLYVGNAGTAARFLTAAAALADGATTIDGNARMRERPIGDLVDALRQLGVEVRAQGEPPCPPVVVAGGGLPGGAAEIDARRSSQYVSAVLLAAPYAQRDVELRFRAGELVSRPYVELTLQVMQEFGAEAAWTAGGGLHVRAGRGYAARDYTVEPDASSAAYPFCAAAISGGRVRVEGIPSDTRQADFALLPLLERMGCRVERPGDRLVEVTGPSGGLRAPGRIDMNALPDAVLALAVTALFADGPTRIENVANLRIKETDRLDALETELRKLGAHAQAGPDFLEIEPRPLRGARIATYDDHRMAMAFALAGLRVPGVVILDPGCVSKTWPQYFDWLATL